MFITQYNACAKLMKDSWYCRKIRHNKLTQKRVNEIYIYGNVRIAHSSIITVCDNAGRIKERAWYGKEVFV